MTRHLLEFFSSLKLTVACLAAALVLVFVGTLAQVNLGIHEVQQRYFQSLLVWWPAEPHGFRLPVFPGGHLLGALLLINLVTAHLRRFRWSWAKLGIHLTHAGLVILLLGGLFTDLFSVESSMRLAPGETRNYSEDPLRVELAVIDTSGKDRDTVTAIPEGVLRRGGVIEHESLPFRIFVRKFHGNSLLRPLGQQGGDAGGKAGPAATQGVGARLTATEIPRVTALNEKDSPSAVVEIVPTPRGGHPVPPLGSWLVSDQLGAPQGFSLDGKTWSLALRPARYYRPYSLTLNRFTHERYPGTEIPKDFASSATLSDPERSEQRDVRISMNHPLRYRGDTFFQSGFAENDAATILLVVRNPVFVAPYLACVVVGLGLIIQFAMHFAGFLRRRKTASAR